MADKYLLPRARQRYIEQVPFLFNEHGPIGGIRHAVKDRAQRQVSDVASDDGDRLEFQTLCAVHRAERDVIFIGRIVVIQELAFEPGCFQGWIRSIMEYRFRPAEDGDLVGLHSLTEPRLQPLG